MTADFVQKRKEMVETQLKSRDIVDASVLKAMSEVPRHEFVPVEFKDMAYQDCPLPIAEGRTISQPYIVALMAQELDLKGEEKVLEIGAGTGYQAAVLSRLAKKVYTIDVDASITEAADIRLRKLCYLNVDVVVGDGTLGLPRNSPYDAIVVTAASPYVPEALKDQLAEGGRLVVPVGDKHSQVMIKLVKKDGEFVEKKVCDCMFVPLVGERGVGE